MTLLFNENEYEIINFTLSISKNVDNAKFVERIDCIFADNSIDLELLAAQIKDEFQGNLTIINGASTYYFTDFGFEDLRFFVDQLGMEKSISLSKILETNI